MYGAIYGDLVGSLYEYREFLKHSKEDMIRASNQSELLTPECFYSDDTILTIAIAEAIKKGVDFEESLRRHIIANSNLLDREDYFKYMFSPDTLKWARGEKEGNSEGNGALMRISPVPYIGKSFMKVTYDTMQATIPSHNSREAVRAATCLSHLIFFAKNGSDRDYLKALVQDYYGYSYDFDLDDLRSNMHFNTTCSETMPLILYVLFNTNSFDDAIRLMLSIGGDTDTNCCIVGSVAEAMYGMDEELKKSVESFLPKEYVKVLRYFKK